MEKQTYTITFRNALGEAASRYASELRNALLDAITDAEVDKRQLMTKILSLVLLLSQCWERDLLLLPLSKHSLTG